MDSTWLDLEFFSVAAPSSPLGIIGDGNAILGSPQPRTAAAPTSALFVEKTRDKHDLNESNKFFHDDLLQPAQTAENSVNAQDCDGQDVFKEFFTNVQDHQIGDAIIANESLDSSPEPIPMSTEQHWMETAMTLDSASDNIGGSERSAIDNIVNEIRSEAQRLEEESNASSDSSEYGGDSIAYTVIEDVPLDESIDGGLPSVTSMESDSSSAGPQRANSTRRKRPLNKDEKRERKKAQNVTAARRYRQKKMAEAMDVHGTLDRLGKRNLQLKASIRTTQAEIEIMKRLLRDVRADLDF